MNALTSPLSPSATAMIRKDHATVMALYHKLTPEMPVTQREAAIRNLCMALDIHAQVEEEIFYPAMREAGIDLPVLARSEPDHLRMRDLMRPLQVEQPDGKPEQRLAALAELMNAVMHHVADEETQLLPAAERRCSHEQLCALGGRMTRRKMALARPHAGELLADAARTSPARATVVTVGALVALAWLLGHRRHEPRHLTA